MLENNGYIKKNVMYLSEPEDKNEKSIRYILSSVYKRFNPNIILCKRIEDIYNGGENTNYSLFVTERNEFCQDSNRIIEIDEELGKKLYSNEEFLVDFMNRLHSCTSLDEIENYVNEENKLEKGKAKVLK